jgi:hypothetical protein
LEHDKKYSSFLYHISFILGLKVNTMVLDALCGTVTQEMVSMIAKKETTKEA